MNKGQSIKRSTKTGRYVTKPLGRAKATRFALVEGVSVHKRSAVALREFEERGLKGDALRTEIAGSFAKNRGK